MEDNQKFFPKVFGGIKDLLAMAINSQHPEAVDIYKKFMTRDSKNKGSITGDTKGYVGPTGYDANFFNKDATNFDNNVETEVTTKDDIDVDPVVDQKDEFNSKVDVLDIVKDIDKGGSGTDIANEVKSKNNLVDAYGDDAINDMLSYAMRNMFGGFGNTKPNAYQIPMMRTAQRGLEY